MNEQFVFGLSLFFKNISKFSFCSHIRLTRGFGAWLAGAFDTDSSISYEYSVLSSFFQVFERYRKVWEIGAAHFLHVSSKSSYRIP